MTRPDEKNKAVTDESDQSGPTRETPFRNAMFVVIGFGIAAALTGLLTMGLIEFAQSIGWWDGSGQ